MKRGGKTKRLVGLTAALLLAIAPAMAEGRFGVTTVDGAALRQEPSASSALSGSYPADTWMAVQGELNGWYAVTAPDGASGYVGYNQLAEPAAQTANVGVVANLNENAYVNLRQSPHYEAAVLGTYHNGAPCLLLSQSNGWYHVRMEGVEGYLREEFVQPQMMVWSEEAATVIAPGGAMVDLREGPGAQYASLGQCPSGAYVMVVLRGDGWWYVSVGGKTGYMEASSLREGVLSLGEIALAAWDELSGAYAVVNNPADTQLLNLREGPTTVSGVLGQYRNGTRLALLNQGLEWCRVRSETGETGYMMTAYLKLEGVPEIPVMTVSHPEGTYVNLRSVPSVTLGAVLAEVPHGVKVEVLIPGTDWVKVRYSGETGYMVAWFLE